MSLTTQSYMGRALRCIVKEGLWGREMFKISVTIYVFLM